MSITELRLDIVILTCAVSAGIHGALVPSHLEETAAAGIGFVVAAVLLGLLALILTRQPSQAALVATVLVFAGLIGSYALAVTTGLPVLHPDVEPVEGLALFTKAVELFGLAAAAALLRHRPLPEVLQAKGTLT